MHPELTNLLPRSSIRALRRSYFMRLITVAASLLIVALIIHGVLLIPSYVHAHGEVKRQQAALAAISEKAASSEEKEANARITAIQTDIEYLGRLGKLPTGSGAIKAVLAIAHPGITLQGFTFTAPAKAGTNAQMTITGTAATRDALRQYVLSLDQLQYADATLPISSYAKESAIPFTITLTGSLLP